MRRCLRWYSEGVMPRKLVGSCWCRAVRYEVCDEFLYAANCHCSNCRRATGSAFESFAGIERTELEVVEGAGALLILGGEARHESAVVSRSRVTFLSGMSSETRVSF